MRRNGGTKHTVDVWTWNTYSIYILYMVRVIISAGLSAALNEIPEMIRRLQYLIIIARNLTPIFIE